MEPNTNRQHFRFLIHWWKSFLSGIIIDWICIIKRVYCKRNSFTNQGSWRIKIDFVCSQYLKHYLDQNGNLKIIDEKEYNESIYHAEIIAKYLLGCTLLVHNQPFVISMVELYYGSAGDDGHDWYRTTYIHNKSENKDRVSTQLKEGLRIYLASDNLNDNYNRMDIVIGPENVAISVLIRNIIDSNGNRIGASKGSPNKIIKEMQMNKNDHDNSVYYVTEITNIDSKKIYLYDTRNRFFKLNNLKENDVYSSCRVNLFSEFEYKNNLKWNFQLKGKNFKLNSTPPKDQGDLMNSSRKNLDRFIDDFSKIDSIEAILLAGSQTSGNADDSSDYDLYVYSSMDINVNDRREIIEPLASYSEIDNRYWETEDDWIMHDGTPIELIYRNWNWMIDQLERTAIRNEASVGYSTCFWYNFISSEILYDPSGKAKQLFEKYSIPYPELLRKNIVIKNWPILNKSMTSYYHQIEKALTRKDFFSINHRIAAYLASWFDIVLAVNYKLHPGEKKLIKFIEDNCNQTPQNWQNDILHLLNTPFIEKEEILSTIKNITVSLEKYLKEINLII